MFEVVCPRCRETIAGPNEKEALDEFSFHCLVNHDGPPQEEQ